jgi:hypothetical protein
MQPSYAQDLGVGSIQVSLVRVSHGVTRLDDHAIAHPLSPSQPSLPCDALRCAAPRSPLTIQHGFYGSMMNGLGSCVGAIGMIPCCPLPNPFKNVGE